MSRGRIASLRVAVPLLSSAVVLSVVHSLSSAAPEPPPPPPPDERSPARPLLALRSAETIEIVADVVRWSTQPDRAAVMAVDGAPILGTFAYRSVGPAYGYDVWIDPTRHEPGDLAVGFDGVQHTVLLDRHADRAVLSSSGPLADPMLPFDHPYFRLAHWAVSFTDRPSIFLSESDLDALTDHQLDIPGEVWATTTIDGAAYEVAALPGGFLHDRPYSVRVVTPIDRRDEPARIELLDALGTATSRTLFADWRDVEQPPPAAEARPIRMPFDVRVQGLTPAGSVVSETRFLVTSARFNLPVPVSTLMPDASSAATCIHEEMGVPLW
jgi:hypothetical protein